MHDERHPGTDQGALAFIGAVTASVSHDMSNVLSTIDQVAGLIEDMLEATKRGVEIDVVRLEMVHGRLAGQTRRGVNIIRKLNTLGHTVDEPLRQENLVRVVETLLVLMERMAARRRIDVSFDPTQESQVVEVPPVPLFHLLYLALLLVMDSYAEGGEVRITFDQEDDAICVCIEGHNLFELEGVEARLKTIHDVASTMDCTVLLDRATPNQLELRLPRLAGRTDR